MGSDRCPQPLIAAIENANNEILFSQISTWEIELKFQQGKLSLPEPPERFIPEAVRRSAFGYQPITDAAIFFLAKLPPLHRDPFDRLLVAQAILGGCTLATLDSKIIPYPVPTIA
jgi:PIN domain nuclease of toxin-antitoxin system